MADNPSIVAEKAVLAGLSNDSETHLPPPTSPSGASSHTNTIPTTLAELDGSEPSHSRTPPPYSSRSSTTLSPSVERAPRAPLRFRGLPQVDYRLYNPPLFTLADDCSGISSNAPYLSASVSALANMIRQQATLPPKPSVHVTGTRGRKVDFDIKLNLMFLIVPEDARARMDYTRCVGADELAFRGGTKPDVVPHVTDMHESWLEEWCRRFIEDPAPAKSFTLERVIANLDTSWIEGQLRSMIAATDYKGAVSVTFPVTHSRVTVRNPDRVNKFFTSVSSLFTGGRRKYEVVKAVWPFATTVAGEEGRQCVVQSEEAWWKEWRDAIKWAIASKKRGWVSVEERLEAVMEGKGKGIEIVDWGP